MSVSEQTKKKATENRANSDPASGLAGLQALIARANSEKSETGGKKKGLPPVERWEPEYCGDIDMQIRRDGTWFYMGTPIGRMPLVRLFSTVLRKDANGETYLVTPVEKIRIEIEDTHFVAVEMNVSQVEGEQVITFRTNVGDIVEAGPGNPIRYEITGSNDGVKPYVLVRGRLEALLARPVMYELVAHGEEIEIDGETMFAVRSRGEVFPIMPVDELNRQVAGK